MEIKFMAQKKNIGTGNYVLVPKPIADILAEGTDYEFIIKEKTEVETQ